MDSTTLSQVIQMIITVVTTVGSLWAIIEGVIKKRNVQLEDKFNARISNLEYKINSAIRSSSTSNTPRKDENF